MLSVCCSLAGWLAGWLAGRLVGGWLFGWSWLLVAFVVDVVVAVFVYEVVLAGAYMSLALVVVFVVFLCCLCLARVSGCVAKGAYWCVCVCVVIVGYRVLLVVGCLLFSVVCCLAFGGVRCLLFARCLLVCFGCLFVWLVGWVMVVVGLGGGGAGVLLRWAGRGRSEWVGLVWNGLVFVCLIVLLIGPLLS